MSTLKGNMRLKYLAGRKQGAYRRRYSSSKAKKSLKFSEDAEEPHRGSCSDDPTTFPNGDPTAPRCNDIDEAIWTPPPPPVACSERDTNVRRKSLRLRTKKQFPITQIVENSPEINRTTSLWIKKHDTRIGNISSDYGTASECSSLYFRPLEGNDGPCIVSNPHDNKVSGNHSLGYSSDLDEVMSNLSIDEVNGKAVDCRRFEDDDESVEECAAKSHLSLNDIRLSDMKTSLQTYRDISVLIPLQGYEISDIPKCHRSKQDSNNNATRTNTHNVRYDLRKRPGCPQELQNIISIETFDINIENEFWKSGLRIFQVTPIISIQPHGVKFCSLYPAIVQLPLNLDFSCGDEVHCLYSNSAVDDLVSNYSSIPWNSAMAGRCSINGDKVNFETFQFGLFVLVIRPKCPYSSSMKNVRSRIGGKLTVSDFPHVEVAFPKEVTEDALLKAEAKIYLDTEKSVFDYLSQRLQNFENSTAVTETDCLASPIIQLEPHGIQFTGEPVMVTLPVPDYSQIVSTLGSKAKLSIWESSTSSNEPSNWKKLEVEYTISEVKTNGEIMTVVTFPVTHFSFFKAIWETISDYLYTSKFGMFYYFVSFPMKCQANMEEYSNQTTSKATADDADGDNKSGEGGRRFGLEVIIFQADKPWPQMATYKYKVGQSNPKLVKPGRICVRLKSLYFEPDVQAGEEEELVKEEPDFRGRDFEHQFICKFKPDVNIERGPFGKVSVSRHVSPRQKGQQIFEFNLQKAGIESRHDEPEEPKEPDEKAKTMLVQSLASNLFLTDGDNWKQFAKELGMTKQELLQLQVENDGNPIEKIVNYYGQRGGSTQELIDAMYRSSRTIRLRGPYSCSGSNHTASSNGSSGRGSLSSNAANLSRVGSHDSDTSGTQTSQDSGLPPGSGRKRSHHSSHASFRGSGISGQSSKHSKRRRVFLEPGPSSRMTMSPPHDADEDSTSTCSSDSDKMTSDMKSLLSVDLHRRKTNIRLQNQSLWAISEHLNNANWLALGRTLGVKENGLIDIENINGKTISLRERAYQMLLMWKQQRPKQCTFGVLYAALEKENMVEAAKNILGLDIVEDSSD